MKRVFEINFDGLVGPTHNYAGLSFGNRASMASKERLSHPKEAALQGLEKMRLIHNLGVKQAVIPPQERPHLPTLKRLGFTNTEQVPTAILQSCCSSASMWSANAATVASSLETNDHKVHITPANLMTKMHRSMEPEATFRFFQKIFPKERFTLHHPVPFFSDEGAANHTRFSHEKGGEGLHLFVYGNVNKTKKFPARQSQEASEAVARLHQLPSTHVVLAEQNPEAIDAGVFHNDVISTGHGRLFLYHEKAFVDSERVLTELEQKARALFSVPLILLPITEKELSLEEAVKSYFFNSQIVTDPAGKIHLIALSGCKIPQNLPVDEVHFVDLRESMQNGGGPACLRLRMVLTEEEIKSIHSPVIFSDELYHKLKKWIHAHYRDSLREEDLGSQALLEESYAALHELTQILQLGPLYEFQR